MLFLPLSVRRQVCVAPRVPQRSRRLAAQAKLFLAMPRRLPPLNALRAFEASARLGSFVAAAAELHVSAAAVSQQVRRLERYLDTTLFNRLARGLVLTEEGRDYLPELYGRASRCSANRRRACARNARAAC